MEIPEPAVRAVVCPTCGGTVTREDDGLRCSACAGVVLIVDRIPRFPASGSAQSTRPLFDSLASVYETPVWFPLVYRLVGGPSAPADDRRTIARLLDPSGDVLDVACGTGRFTRYVADRASIAWGIDLSVGMLRRAVRYADRDGIENATFARMDAESLYFEDDAFDGVACCWAIHLFSDPAAALREMRRVLNPGGALAGATVVDRYLLGVPGARAGMRRTFGAHVFAEDGFRRLLHDAGFETVDLDRRGAALFFRAR